MKRKPKYVLLSTILLLINIETRNYKKYVASAAFSKQILNFAFTKTNYI